MELNPQFCGQTLYAVTHLPMIEECQSLLQFLTLTCVTLFYTYIIIITNCSVQEYVQDKNVWNEYLLNIMQDNC